MKIKLLPIQMGGTIASVESAHGEGFSPGLSFNYLLHHMLEHSAELDQDFLENFEIEQVISPFGDDGLDSSQLQNHHIEYVANIITTHYDDDDAFLVTHGTDTMANSAALLSFLLQGLDKPIILTGSQKTLCSPFHDVYSNLSNALKVVKHGIVGVWIVFGSYLFSGVRVTKVDTERLEAFASNNHSAIPLKKIFTTPLPPQKAQKRKPSDII